MNSKRVPDIDSHLSVCLLVLSDIQPGVLDPVGLKKNTDLTSDNFAFLQTNRLHLWKLLMSDGL